MRLGDLISSGVVLSFTVLLAAPVAAQEAQPPQQAPSEAPAQAAPAQAAPAPAQAPTDAGTPAAAPTEAQKTGDEIAALVKQADALYAKREPGFSGENIDQCIALLEEGVKKHPKSYALLWRLSRAYFWKADGAPNNEIKSEWGEKAMKIGDEARELDPKKVEGQYYAAVGVGAYSQGMGILTALMKGMEGKFNDRLDKALAINPDYDCGGPMNAKGRYFYELPWPKYNGKKSIEWLDKALKVCPDNARTMYYLAETDIKEGKKAQAQEMVQRGLAVNPATYEDPPDVRRAQIWLRQLQAKMKK